MKKWSGDSDEDGAEDGEASGREKRRCATEETEESDRAARDLVAATRSRRASEIPHLEMERVSPRGLLDPTERSSGKCKFSACIGGQEGRNEDPTLWSRKEDHRKRPCGPYMASSWAIWVRGQRLTGGVSSSQWTRPAGSPN